MKEIQLTRGYKALVDDEDYERCTVGNRWQADVHKNGKVYARRESQGKMERLHRFILGVTDPKIEVDHKDGDGLNCTRDNIRLASHAENQQNQKKSRYRTHSKYKGVSWNERRQKWLAYINVGSKRTYLGCDFIDEKEAAMVYDTAARKLHGEFAVTNF